MLPPSSGNMSDLMREAARSSETTVELPDYTESHPRGQNLFHSESGFKACGNYSPCFCVMRLIKQATAVPRIPLAPFRYSGDVRFLKYAHESEPELHPDSELGQVGFNSALQPFISVHGHI
jgi:hypothetical protein